MLFKHKTLDIGFIVLAVNTVEQTRRTIDCVKSYFSDSSLLVISDQEVNRDVKIVKNKNDKKSHFFNLGIKSPPCSEWNIFVFGGTTIKPFAIRKFSCFVDSEKDILLPVLERKINFTQSNLNGLLVHKKTLKKIGQFSEKGGFEESKLYWAEKAINNQCKFKSIIGTRLIYK